MDALDLRQRIRGGENLHTDFKERFDSHAAVAKQLVCFANTDGGQVVFGVSDRDRTVTGVDDPEALALRIDEVAYEHCEPPVTALTEVIELDGRAVVVVSVAKGSARPYRTKSGKFSIRSGARCRSASREELLRLFQAAGSLFFDETPLPSTTLADLDLDAFEDYLEDAGLSDLTEQDPPRLLRNWRLFDGRHATVAGVLLFGRRPQRQIPYAHIAAARFPGVDTSADPADRTDLSGRLLDVLDRAAAYLDTHLRTEHRIRGFEPERYPELPEAALREAVVNALAHRDYTVRGPVRLFVLDDRIEVHTPGAVPNTIDEAAMRAGAHVVRNPAIYARLSDAGLVTRAGTGIRRMIRLVREATGKDVGISLHSHEVLVCLPRPTASTD
ncbi:MAG: RNA-binding domain-containing protein [Egibacteraceae bacterium]